MAILRTIIKIIKFIFFGFFKAIWVLVYLVFCIFFPSLRPQIKAETLPLTTEALVKAETPPLTAEALVNYFRNPDNYALQDIKKLVGDVGQWQEYDDWDWGRFVYEWRRPNLRVRVITQSDCVRCVELLAPTDISRMGSCLEIIWEHPAQP
jgi:hypothetical protein